MGLEDVNLIAKIELRWMQIHQKSQMPSTRLITKGMARGIYCEEKKTEGELGGLCGVDQCRAVETKDEDQEAWRKRG